MRKALGTAVEKDGEIVSDPAGINNDGKSKSVQDGSLEINGKTYTVRELAPPAPPLGAADYFTALNDVEKYALDSKKDSVLVKGLSLSELESLRG